MVLEHYSKESTTGSSNLPSEQSKRSTGSQGKENITQGLQLNKPPLAQNSNIETNFQRAMIAQNEEYSEVTEFLSSLKLEKYKEVFIENGIEDKETILELNEEHLQEMGLPLGHKLKIMKKIKESRKHVESERQTHFTAQPQKVSSSTETAVKSDSLLDGVYDEEQNK